MMEDPSVATDIIEELEEVSTPSLGPLPVLQLVCQVVVSLPSAKMEVRQACS